LIVSRTPFRLTLGGGGTDLPSYYRKHGGFIFAMGIDKYMYLMVNRPELDGRVRLRYSRSETVAHVSELRHELAREALRLHGVEQGIEISSMADLPDGTGLGSSGAYLVGLLAALRRLRGLAPNRRVVAEEACRIELEVLGRGVGKQDQYMAAFGGLTVLEISRGGSVSVRRAAVPPGMLDELVANTHLYYTGRRRRAERVLADQDAAMRNGGAGNEVVADSLHRIKDLGHRILEAIEAGDCDGWGRLLHEHWTAKRRLSARVSYSRIDQVYDRVQAFDYATAGVLAAVLATVAIVVLLAVRWLERTAL
jgi:D-glycero-alpha-D-manno-heptose-7-phosphate kinase